MTKKKLYDIAERVVNTWWQAALVFILAQNTLDVDILGAAALAGLPATFNLLYRLVMGVRLRSQNLALDIASRVGVTFGSTLLGLLSASGFDYTDVAGWKMAVIAAGTSAVSVLKGALAAHFVPNTLTPASLVPVPTKVG